MPVFPPPALYSTAHPPELYAVVMTVELRSSSDRLELYPGTFPGM